MRSNNKKELVSYENSIKKSNEFSMAKLNHGLSLNQMQLLAFAIFSTQQDGKTEFQKHEFEKKFGIEQYRTEDAYVDSDRILDLKVSMQDLENDRFSHWNVFTRMEYENGQFMFKWTPEFIPHILELKEKYISTDLTITAKFKSGFSWRLYEFLKAHYGYWHRVISKEALMKLFGVENYKSYVNNTGLFKVKVLDVAISELNEHTELEVWYKEIKKGRTITGFDLHWSTGEKIESATKKQIDELQAYIDIVFEDMFKYVNINDQEHREKAIELVRRLEAMKDVLTEPISITKSYTDRLIKDARWILNELESYLKADGKGLKNPGYNWLQG